MTSTPQNHGRIVVGVDGSPSSLAALDWAAGQGELTGSSLELVMAWEWPTVYGAPFAFPTDWNPAADAARVLRLAEVAAAYRTGVSDPSVTNPSSYVAKTLAISGSYARKLIYDARAVGLLRPAPGRGRAGEISTNGQKKP